MKSVAVILGSISAVHAGGDRKLAAPAGTHYGQSGMKDPVTGEDMTNIQWAAYDLDDGKGHGSTPTPHEAFGTYNCRGYYQSPIDVPRKAMQTEYRKKGSKYVNTEDYHGQHAVPNSDSVFAHYVFGNAQNLQRRVTDGLPDKYVSLLGKFNMEQWGLKVPLEPVPLTAAGALTTTTAVSKTNPLGIYRPLQFHWHFPSEHTVDGQGYPAELHIVHTRLSHFRSGDTSFATRAGVFYTGTFDSPGTDDACSDKAKKTLNLAWTNGALSTADKDYAVAHEADACTAFTDKHLPYLVLGFFLTDSRVNVMHQTDLPPVGGLDATSNAGGIEAMKALDAEEKDYADDCRDNDKCLAQFVKKVDGTNNIGASGYQFDYKKTFGAAMKGRYFRYQGGLTTPPCTEGVEWVLFERPLFVHSDFFSLSYGTADTDSTADAVDGDYPNLTACDDNAAAPDTVGDCYMSNGPQDISTWMKATPVWLRNNRPTIPIHGREVAYSKLTAMKNPVEADPAGGNTGEGAGGSNFNYLKPEVMWAKNNCWKDDPDNAGQRIQCNNQCGNAIADPIKARQAPINIVGAEVYKGVTPVNHGWLAANTFGYVDANLGTASKWVLKNTGHGFNVIPQFSFAGGAASHKDGQQSNTKPYTLTDFHASHRSLAGYGATVPHQYYVKKINAAANKVSWYPLQQFHFHFPSENTVDGYQYDGEMHMVHMGDGSFVEALKKNETKAGAPKQRIRQLKDAEGKDAVVIDISDMSARQLAAAPAATATATADPKKKNFFGDTWADAVVFGFFLTAKEDSDTHFNSPDAVVPGNGPDTLMSVFGFDKDEGVPYTRGHYWTVEVANKKLGSVLFGPNVHGKQSLDATPQYDLSSPSTRNYFNYMGGLTTPGCNEGVQFIIFTDPLIIKKSEMRLFKQNYWANNRPTQPRGDRIVLFNDMANAQHPLKGMNKMTKVNPFAPVEKSSSTTIYAVSSSGGAATNALSMIVGAVMSTVTLALMM